MLIINAYLTTSIVEAIQINQIDAWFFWDTDISFFLF